jgi:hypothetical protein
MVRRARKRDSNGSHPGPDVLWINGIALVDLIDRVLDALLDEAEQSIRILVAPGQEPLVEEPVSLTIHQGHIRLRSAKVHRHIEAAVIVNGV